MNFFHGGSEFVEDDDLGLGVGIDPYNNGNGITNPMANPMASTPSRGVYDFLGGVTTPLTTPFGGTGRRAEDSAAEMTSMPIGSTPGMQIGGGGTKARSLSSAPLNFNPVYIGHESALLRPSIEQLLEQGDTIGALDEGFKQDEAKVGYGFGWIEGVYVRCTLSIFGVIMFLRLNWMFAQAGIGGAIGVIFYSVCVTSLTTMSLSAISTNGKVAAGGVYFMVSRCMGADIGVVVGLSLFIAQALAVALNLVGFGESVVNLEMTYMIDREWDAKIFGLCGLVACFGIAFLGAKFEIQAQKVLFVSMMVALLMFFVGVMMAKQDDTLRSTALSGATLASNASPAYSPGNSWVTVFGVFFPAVTGISAGSSISGDLKDPSDAIPKGTFLAILTTTVIYLLMGVLMSACFTPDGLADITTQIDAIDISLFPPLVYLGVFSAALSSALALLVGAPRILMAMARDDVVSWLGPFKKGYFAMDEPLRGYILVICIAFIAILALDLNSVSPLVTNFYLVQYGFINFSVASAHFAKAPGWRPSFKYYNAYLATLGTILCVASMFMVGFVTAILTLALAVACYQYVVMNKPNVNWGDSTQAAMHMKACQHMYALERSQTHVKNWRPQYLFLAGNLEERPDMLIAMKLMKKSRGVMIAGNVLIGNLYDQYVKRAEAEYNGNVMINGIEGFTSVVVAPTLLEGVTSLLQISGLGKLKANTVILGYKYKWQMADVDALEEYREIIRISFLTRHGVGIIKNLTSNSTMALRPTQQPHIDIWWLVEDGGLTLLSAFLLVRHRQFRMNHTTLRLFLSCDEANAQKERADMTLLLSTLRIEAVIIIVDKNRTPSAEGLANFQKLSECPDQDLSDERVIHFVNTQEEMRKYSKYASMVVVSLPVPKKSVPIKNYFAYLEILSEERPTILIRGNQDTVLTTNS